MRSVLSTTHDLYVIDMVLRAPPGHAAKNLVDGGFEENGGGKEY